MAMDRVRNNIIREKMQVKDDILKDIVTKQNGMAILQDESRKFT